MMHFTTYSGNTTSSVIANSNSHFINQIVESFCLSKLADDDLLHADEGRNMAAICAEGSIC